MAGREHQAGLSSILTLLLTAALSAGQKLNAVESNGVFFSGLPRPPSEINAITAKGSDAFGNTLGRGLLEKFTTPNPLKIGSTPFDFRFNSAKPDNRFAVTGGRTPSVLVTRPPFFTGNPTSPTTAPRFAAPTTPRPPPPPPPPPATFRPPPLGQGAFRPTTQRITTLRPVTQRPATLPPTVPRPTTKRPTPPRATTQRLTTQRPTTQRPTTQRPTTQRLTTQRPTTQRPTTQRPTTQRPTTQRPTTQRPTTQRPTTQRPTTRRFTTQRSTTARTVPNLRPATLQALQPAPRLAFQPGSSQGTGSTAGQSTPFFPINSSPPSQRSQGTGATAEQPTPFFPINSSPPSQRSQGTGSSAGQPTPFFPANSSPPSQRAQSPVATTRPPAPFFPINTTPAPHPAAERSFNAINTARTTFPVPTPPRRRIFVPASALNTGTSFTTTTARPQTRFATLTFGTEFSTFRPATRTTTPPPTVTGFTGTGSNLNFAFCDQRQCVKMCRERFGDRLNSSSCQANACKCEVTEACSPSLCLQMCRKNNPGQQVISAGCQGDNCRCVFNKPCEPSECRRRCLLAHGDKLISADCAVRNACQCVHS
ncbi:uncharacterized protein LOC144099447 isoform X1 [Amblyomma americanum]